jgi:alkylation response protein AidB-like acyl-CoA dehydrogenase
VPSANVLGGVNEGWRVAMATASSERGLTLRSPGRFLAAADRLIDLYRRRPAEHLRDEVAQAWMNAEAYRLLTFQAISRMLATGQPMGSEASLMKLWWSELDVHLNQTAQRLVGADGELGLDSEDATDGGAWLDGWLFSLAGPIYAGTNEIQRNVVAERVLGLPRV